MTDSTPEVAAEQAYLDHAHVCLAAMRARAARNVEIAELRAREEPSPDTSRLLQELEHRHALLAESPMALAFGRLDEETGERFYVGRRHVEDARGDPVVVDWRADVSVPFYRATWADPMGIDRRRRFALERLELLGLFDENFADPDSEGAGGGGGVPDPLLAELERGRSGEMRDIVATIQAEQDEVIRAPLAECLVVQGGPGTGKTAVGLHRAAYLLYEHRERLERERLLVIGPNLLFLRYIAQVLPSLGETAVTQTTLPGLVAHRFRVRAEDPEAVVAVKGDARMATVITRAARSAVATVAPDDTALRAFGVTLHLSAAAVQGVLDTLHARQVPLRVGREQLRARLEQLALDQYTALRPEADEQDLAGELRTRGELTTVVNRLWPVPSAPVLVRRILGNRRLLERSSVGVLTDEERAQLFRKPSRKVSEELWTRADLGLLDEADWVVGGPSRTFGHVVVDEAQDHSAMELRLLARRSAERSMTLLGDLAQATAIGAQTSWPDALDALDAPHGRVAELELGYRVPAPVLEFANRLLPVAAPGVRPSRSVRETGAAPHVLTCASPDEFAEVTAVEVAAQRADDRSVGIVAPEPRLDSIAIALAESEIEFTDGRTAVGLGESVTLIPPESAKGLEFDAVIVVEPAAIAGVGDHGLRLLYIALTRAVRTLTLIHAEPLPEPLRMV